MVEILFNHPAIFSSFNLVFLETLMIVLLKENRFLLSVNVIGSKIYKSKKSTHSF